jgi:hypothetical protein
MVEHAAVNRRVVGSSPTRGAIPFARGQRAPLRCRAMDVNGALRRGVAFAVAGGVRMEVAESARWPSVPLSDSLQRRGEPWLVYSWSRGSQLSRSSSGNGAPGLSDLLRCVNGSGRSHKRRGRSGGFREQAGTASSASRLVPSWELLRMPRRITQAACSPAMSCAPRASCSALRAVVSAVSQAARSIEFIATVAGLTTAPRATRQRAKLRAVTTMSGCTTQRYRSFAFCGTSA